MEQNRSAKRKNGRAKQARGKHSFQNVDQQRAPDLPRWLDIDSGNAAQKEAVQKQCQAQAQAPTEVQELYGSFLPSYGLQCSRVCSGKGGMSFVHPIYADHAPLHSTQHPPFAPPTPSSSPATSKGSSSSSLEETGASPSLEVARQHGSTPCERQQAQSFAEQLQGGLLHLCLAVAPRDRASEDPDGMVGLPAYKEELRPTFPPETSVKIVSGAGARFTGVLPVDGGACIVFDPTCSDAVISDSMATGGMVVCYGRGCHVTFSNCHFDLDTNIVALAGASVQLTGCTFTRNGFNVVFAHACGTCVTVESCFFTGGVHPVSVAGGASATVTGSTFNRPLGTAMVARDKGSLLKAETCRVQGAGPTAMRAQHSPSGTRPTGSNLAPARGVLVYMGARLELKSADITNVGVGVAVCQRSAAVLTGCSVATTTEVTSSAKATVCVLSNDSIVELSHCVLTAKQDYNNPMNCGVAAVGSSVKLQGCRVLSGREGVALYGSKGVLADCDFECCVRASMLAADHSALDMRACVCKKSPGYGVMVKKSDCRLAGVTVAGSAVGFSLEHIQSYAEIAECKAMDVTGQGLLVSGAGARVRVQGFQVRVAVQRKGLETCCRAVGIFVSTAAKVDLDSCKVAEGPGGLAVVAAGDGTEVQCEDCQLSGGTGASAEDGAQMTLRRCATHKCGTKGYFASKRAVLNLHNCTSTGDFSGFLCGEQGRLHAQDCELRGFCGGALVCSGNGMGGTTCKLDRCRFVGERRDNALFFDGDGAPFPPGVGVFLQGKDARVSMHGCTVSGTAGDCVSVMGGAKATLEGCQLSHSHKGGVFCIEQSSEVFLDGCSISNSEERGVLCLHGGRVVAQRVHSCGNKQGGFEVCGDCSMTLKECSSDKDQSGCVARGQHDHRTPNGTARVVLSGVLVRRSSEAGFCFDSHTRGCMKHCVALQCGKGGMYMRPPAPGEPLPSGGAPGLSVFDSTFERCRFPGGVMVLGRSPVSMQNVLCSRNEGTAFGCVGAGSRLVLTRCEVDRGNVQLFEPYLCAVGGKLHCIECTPAGPCMDD